MVPKDQSEISSTYLFVEVSEDTYKPHFQNSCAATVKSVAIQFLFGIEEIFLVSILLLGESDVLFFKG